MIGSTASMKWKSTNDWNTIVISDSPYVTFGSATVTWLSPSTPVQSPCALRFLVIAEPLSNSKFSGKGPSANMSQYLQRRYSKFRSYNLWWIMVNKTNKSEEVNILTNWSLPDLNVSKLQNQYTSHCQNRLPYYFIRCLTTRYQTYSTNLAKSGRNIRTSRRQSMV